MTAFSIDAFRAALPFDGARNNLFKVFITNPIDPSGDFIAPFLIRAASLPNSDINTIDVPYAGRYIKVAGVRPPFPEWQVTIVNDEDFKIRNALETWHNGINALEGNVRKLASSSPSQYQTVIKVQQYSKVDVLLREYELINAWPSSITPIDLSHDNDNIETFDAIFQMDYWRIGQTQTGIGGGT